MRHALDLAQSPGVPTGPNPRVGCVLLDEHGAVLAEGFHGGAGSPHAEVSALRRAGARADGATAVVTLEPCNHTGRTGPCSQALIGAGVTRVVYAQSDPNPLASGGAGVLRESGVDVLGGLLADEARAVNRHWTFAMEHGRPFVTWKVAGTLDGRSAAADGTSRWVSNPAARDDTQRLRAQCDAILVGTGTVLSDDPALTRRDAHGRPLPPRHQLLRVVMGLRDVPADRRVSDDEAETLVLHTREPAEVLQVLHGREVRHLLVEGGSTVAAAFLRAGLVDEVVAYVAPMLLGAGSSTVGDLGITTMADALTFALDDVTVLDDNLRLTLTPASAGR